MNRSAAMTGFQPRRAHPLTVSALRSFESSMFTRPAQAGHIAEHGQVHTHVRLAAEMLQGQVEFHGRSTGHAGSTGVLPPFSFPPFS